jgi:hypothetical protein
MHSSLRVLLPALVCDQQLQHQLLQALIWPTNSEVHNLAIHTHTPAACGNGSVPAFLVSMLSEVTVKYVVLD